MFSVFIISKRPHFCSNISIIMQIPDTGSLPFPDHKVFKTISAGNNGGGSPFPADMFSSGFFHPDFPGIPLSGFLFAFQDRINLIYIIDRVGRFNVIAPRIFDLRQVGFDMESFSETGPDRPANIA